MDYQNLSKIISHALRHEPWLYELELDAEGWTEIVPLLSALRKLNKEWVNIQRADIEEMIIRSEKIRHEIKADKIRALYGHSLSGKLSKISARPPDILFHGTNPDVVGKIMKKGLKPMSRQYVHLSTTEGLAKEVGLRKSKQPIILNVKSAQAYDKGVHFYIGNNKVWLADEVPPEFIE